VKGQKNRKKHCRRRRRRTRRTKAGRAKEDPRKRLRHQALHWAAPARARRGQRRPKNGDDEQKLAGGQRPRSAVTPQPSTRDHHSRFREKLTAWNCVEVVVGSKLLLLIFIYVFYQCSQSHFDIAAPASNPIFVTPSRTTRVLGQLTPVPVHLSTDQPDLSLPLRGRGGH